MSNNYFKFKQFRVNQEHCAMKVSTDAFIQGVWTEINDRVENVLDIGTGTGLLSLMLAQKNHTVHIDALEIDAHAARQAQENIAASPWANRINIYLQDARAFHPEKKYDLVICNPPFFSNSLLSDTEARSVARHSISFSMEDLLAVIIKCLANDGSASVLLPFTEHQQWASLLRANGFSIAKELHIYPREASKPNRIVSICTKQKAETITEILAIRKSNDTYTDAFMVLMRPYYLHL